jgi:hypothetical protein
MIMLNNSLVTKQFLLTVPAGKRLIAKAVASLEQIKRALEENTIVIISGTTNSYVAEELLLSTNQLGDFIKDTFYRGITLAPGKKAVTRNEGFSGKDVILEKGKWIKDKAVFDIVADLGPGDIIIKGANAVDEGRNQAGVLVANPSIGTSGPILQAVIGKRVELIIPVGLEKRVYGNIGQIAALLNAPATNGLRMAPISGTIITELEALEQLTGAKAQLFAAGGVIGAEGSVWIALTGTPDQLRVAETIVKDIEKEPPFSV